MKASPSRRSTKALVERAERPYAPPSLLLLLLLLAAGNLGSDGFSCILYRLIWGFLALEVHVESLGPGFPHRRHLRDRGEWIAVGSRLGKHFEIGVGDLVTHWQPGRAVGHGVIERLHGI